MGHLGEMSIPVSQADIDAILENKQIAWCKPASDEAVYDVLAASEEGDDGRSEWLWIRLVDGSLILGFFPQGDTYFQHEGEHSG